jgi:hypothetical protein
MSIEERIARIQLNSVSSSSLSLSSNKSNDDLFNINQYGSSITNIEKEGKEEEKEKEKEKEEEENKKNRKKDSRFSELHVVTRKKFHKESKFDFIQEIIRTEGEELSIILNIFIELFSIESHPNRIPYGDIEQKILNRKNNIHRLCLLCDQLDIYIKESEEAIKFITRYEREHEIISRKNKIKNIFKINKEEKGDNKKDKDKDKEDIKEKQKYVEYQRYLKHDGYGSELLQKIGKNPKDLRIDVNNTRKCIIICLMCHSESIQRLVTVGKIFSEKYECAFRYTFIPPKSLDEFIYYIDTLKNEYYTGQISSFNFINIIQHLVECGGVHTFVEDVLKIARIFETKRLQTVGV